MLPAGEMLDEDVLDVLEAAGVDEVKVRNATDLRNPLRHLRQVLRPRFWAVVAWSIWARRSA